MRRWHWLATAALPLAVLLLWAVRGESGPDVLELPRGLEVGTATVLTVAALLTTAALLACAWNLRAGLVALGGVMFAMALFWPAVQDNRYSGEVIISFGGGHGLHENDWYALGPAAVGAIALVAARQLDAAPDPGPADAADPEADTEPEPE